MLDEPLGALDRTLRERLMDELRAILRELGMTVLYVTHDQAEAFALADRLAVLNAGRIVQVGAPPDVYRRPAGEFVARFLGLTNILPARPLAAGGAGGGRSEAETALGRLVVSGPPPDGANAVLVRPEAARLLAEGAASADVPEANILMLPVRECSFRGRLIELTVAPAGGPELRFELAEPAAALPAVGETVRLGLDPEAIGWLQASPSSSTS
jgi:ABC-type Fe3+/spermidine/putrescine transport system ATPase subunit